MPDAPATYAPPALDLLDLMRVHPLWIRHRGEWEEIRDITSGALSDKARLKRYLPRAMRETDGEYEARVAMTEVVPECMVARERIIGGLFSTKPTRDLSESLDKWTKRVDRDGHALDHFLETSVMPAALDYGAAHVLVDRMPDGGTPPKDRAEQEKRGLLWPYLATYTPLELRQWAIGEDGALLWIMIVETGYVVDQDTGKRAPSRTYRRFDRTGWAKWTVKPAKAGAPLPLESWSADGEPLGDAAELRRGVIVDGPEAGPHSAPGFVPCVSFIPSKIDELVGRSIIGPAVRLDLRMARLESDRAWDLYVHAHPYLTIKTTSTLSVVGAGSNEFLKLNPETNEDAKYLDLPRESFEARERAIADTRTDLYRHLGIDPLGVVTDSPGDASGVARAWSFSTSEARHLGRHADRIEDGEKRLLKLVALYAGEQEPDDGAVKWPETFETAAPTQLIEDAIAFRQACRSDTAQRIVEKRLARHLIGEQESEVLDTIDQEIEQGDAQMRVDPAVVVAQ